MHKKRTVKGIEKKFALVITDGQRCFVLIYRTFRCIGDYYRDFN